MLGGLQRNEPVLVVSTPQNLEALRAALDIDGRTVDYRDSTQWYDDPASTLRRYRDYIQERGANSRLRIVGEPVWSARSGVAVDDWLRYESIVNLALETARVSIMCPYDADALPPQIVSGALRTHPHVDEAGEVSDSPEYRDFFRTSARAEARK
jgi:hypothetical protein